MICIIIHLIPTRTSGVVAIIVAVAAGVGAGAGDVVGFGGLGHGGWVSLDGWVCCRRGGDEFCLGGYGSRAVGKKRNCTRLRWGLMIYRHRGVGIGFLLAGATS